MENDVCKLTVIQNPNRRYANTVNIVFFRAIPLTKNFQKYVDGLRGWKEYIKNYPDSQLQLFVDRSIAEDVVIQSLLKELNSRVIMFECPDYLRNDGFHLGLFGTMLRFYPLFDINTHPMSIAHVCELEPDTHIVAEMPIVDKISKIKGLSLVYESTDLFRVESRKREMMGKFPFPWISAGKFTGMQKVPFKLWSNYVRDIKSGKQHSLSRTGNIRPGAAEHGAFSFGIDESFLNYAYLPWLIKHDATIGILIKCNPAISAYFLMKTIRHDKRSRAFFNYILKKNQSLEASLDEFDKMFYYKDTEQITDDLKEYADRYYEIIRRYPDWLSKDISERILTLNSMCNGYRKLLIVKGRVIQKIVDV
jgi:hypothetical protein